MADEVLAWMEGGFTPADKDSMMFNDQGVPSLSTPYISVLYIKIWPPPCPARKKFSLSNSWVIRYMVLFYFEHIDFLEARVWDCCF